MHYTTLTRAHYCSLMKFRNTCKIFKSWPDILFMPDYVWLIAENFTKKDNHAILNMYQTCKSLNDAVCAFLCNRSLLKEVEVKDTIIIGDEVIPVEEAPEVVILGDEVIVIVD